MIYIERNAQGEIGSLHFSPADHREEIDIDDPKLSEFIRASDNSEELIQSVLDSLDKDMVRVIEDLIDILIDRNLILFTDLPEPVQNKLIFKKKIRNLSSDAFLLEEELINF